MALLGLIVFLLFAVLVLPAQSAQSLTYSGTVGSPDRSFFYTPQDLYRMAQGYGEAGRRAYVRSRLTFDTPFPLVYAFFLITAIGWVVTRAGLTATPWRWANLLPILGLLFDYLENLSAAIVMSRYPAPTPIVDLLTTLFTPLKWVFVGGSILVLALLIARGVWRRLAAGARA